MIATGNCSPVAISCGPVQLPVFVPVANWTSKHYGQGTWMAIWGSASIKAIGATAYLQLVVLSQVQITRPRWWTLASLTMNHDSRQTYSNESAHRSSMFVYFVDISDGGSSDCKTASTTIHLYEPPKEQTTYIRGHCDSETTENCKGHSTKVYCPSAISSRESAN